VPPSGGLRLRLSAVPSDEPQLDRRAMPDLRRRQASEKDAKLAQKLGQPQAFMAVFRLKCVGQLASFGPT
jgi:hypothetical protein